MWIRGSFSQECYASPFEEPEQAAVLDTLTASYGEGTIADHDATKDSWNVKLKIHEPYGEIYYLNFTKKDLKISSYENDAILTKVDTWADSVTSLN